MRRWRASHSNPGVYRCAASVGGISDVHRFLRWIDERSLPNRASERFWRRFMGVWNADDPTLDTISPARHAASVSVPALLVHGRDDTVVPFEQTQIIADALQHAGKRVDVVTLSGEDHWMSRSETRLQLLEHVIGFLKANDPVD
jgi:dipeptidyl aminopeptidase/acylaminoacyl peptidase